MGRYEEAEACQQAMEIVLKAVGPNHPNTKTSRPTMTHCEEARIELRR